MSQIRDRDTARDVLLKAKAILVDLDGCFLAGDRTLAPGARDLFQRAGDRIAVVSNNSTHLPETMAVLLKRLRAPLPASRIFLAGTVAVDRLAEARPEARTMFLALPPIVERGRERGLNPVTRDAEAVLLCRDLKLTYDKVASVIRAVHRGAELWVANPDITRPDSEGVPVLDTGALLGLIRQAVPNLQAEIVGKPRAGLFNAALDALDCAPENAVMVGNSPLTSGVGAAELGLPFILIGRHPDAIASDLAALLPEPVK